MDSHSLMATGSVTPRGMRMATHSDSLTLTDSGSVMRSATPMENQTRSGSNLATLKAMHSDWQKDLPTHSVIAMVMHSPRAIEMAMQTETLMAMRWDSLTRWVKGMGLRSRWETTTLKAIGSATRKRWATVTERRSVTHWGSRLRWG